MKLFKRSTPTYDFGKLVSKLNECVDDDDKYEVVDSGDAWALILYKGEQYSLTWVGRRWGMDLIIIHCATRRPFLVSDTPTVMHAALVS